MAELISNLFDLKGKTAVITGGSGAICGTMAENLAHNGVHVILIDINRSKAEERASAIRSSGGIASVYEASVLDEPEMLRICEDIYGRSGAPDFLLNGAGGNHPSGSASEKYMLREHLDWEETGSIFDIDFESFQRVVALNLHGTFLPSKIFGQQMVQAGRGSIVNISSMSGIIPLTKVAAYSAAKASVINFTKWMAVHLSKTGVRVNTVAPGFIATEQSRFLQFDPVTGELNQRGHEIIDATPLGRFGEPEEIFGALVWLFSKASDFVTGTVIPVDGGFSAYSI